MHNSLLFLRLLRRPQCTRSHSLWVRWRTQRCELCRCHVSRYSIFIRACVHVSTQIDLGPIYSCLSRLSSDCTAWASSAVALLSNCLPPSLSSSLSLLTPSSSSELPPAFLALLADPAVVSRVDRYALLPALALTPLTVYRFTAFQVNTLPLCWLSTRRHVRYRYRAHSRAPLLTSHVTFGGKEKSPESLAASKMKVGC